MSWIEDVHTTLDSIPSVVDEIKTAIDQGRYDIAANGAALLMLGLKHMYDQFVHMHAHKSQEN